VNATELADLLRYCSSLDPWLKQTSPEEATVMLAGWGTILGPVPADEAMRAARAHYSEPGARTITPGDVLDAWRASRREAAQVAERAEVEQLALVGPPSVLTSKPAVSYLTALRNALDLGLDTKTVAAPEGLRFRSHASNVRARRCQWHELCACDHLECRDGWSDEVIITRDDAGRRHEAVRRCAHCWDALKMAEERGLLKKVRRTTHSSR
jgi:hypothetical protein